MPTAQELLSSTTGPEEHIVIGTDRHITVPKPLQRIAVQFDHDVETVTFDCPRYWDDIDMSTMTVYINYKLPNGDLDAYPAKNIKAEGDIMHFDWTISNKVTQYKGKLTFLVCIKKTGNDGIEVNHWNSELCTDMYISEGMECEEQAQMEYSDLITQLLERMTVVEQINVQADEMREMHDEVLDETTGIRQTSANAIKGYASGDVIQIDDISPVEHISNVLVHSKNLLTYPYNETSKTQNGLTFTDNGDGSITINGTATDATYFNFIKSSAKMPINKGKYVISLNSNDSNVRMFFGVNDNNDKQIVYGGHYSTASFDVTKNGSYYAFIAVSKDATVSNLVVYPQLEQGDTATEYEPYIDPTTVTVTGCGKNLFDGEWESGAINTSTGEKQANSSSIRTVNYIPVQPNATCYFSVDADCSYFPYSYDKNKNFVAYKGMKKGPFSLTMDENECYIILVQYGNVEQPINTQVEFGSNATSYEPFKGGSYTPNADGTCDVKSVSPFMQIFTDTPGVTIDCEYNRDTKKVIDNAIKEVNGIKYITESVEANTLEEGIYFIDGQNGGEFYFGDPDINAVTETDCFMDGAVIVTLDEVLGGKRITIISKNFVDYQPILFSVLIDNDGMCMDYTTTLYVSKHYVDEQIATLQSQICEEKLFTFSFGELGEDILSKSIETGSRHGVPYIKMVFTLYTATKNTDDTFTPYFDLPIEYMANPTLGAESSVKNFDDFKSFAIKSPLLSNEFVTYDAMKNGLLHKGQAKDMESRIVSFGENGKVGLSVTWYLFYNDEVSRNNYLDQLVKPIVNSLTDFAFQYENHKIPTITPKYLGG